MQRSLRVLDNFYLDYEVIRERPLRVWVMYAFTLEAVFFPFFQRSPRFLQSLESGASSVLLISHCFPRLDFSKLIGITVFDGETVPPSFSIFRNAFCCQIFVHISQKPPFCESSSPFLFDLPGEFSDLGLTAKWKYSFRTSFQNINPLCLHHCLNFVIIKDVLRREPGVLKMLRMKDVKSFQPPCGFGVRNFYGFRGSPWPILTGKRRFFCKPKNLCFVLAAIGFTSPLR